MKRFWSARTLTEVALSAALLVVCSLISVPTVLFGPTGGYILGFLLTGLCYWLYERLGHERVPLQALSLLLGLALCYTFGTAWFVRVYTGEITLARALALCVWPFIVPDLIKLALALPVGRRVRKALGR